MTRTRIVGGKITETTGGNYNIYTKESIVYSAASTISETGVESGVSYGSPEKAPPLKKNIIKGWWTDNKNNPIKEALIGDTIRFHIETKDIPDGENVTFTIYDWDGMLNIDDKVDLVISGTTSEANKIKITGNKGYVEWITGLGSQGMIEEEGDDEIELYVKCTYKAETIDLPISTDDYLILFEKEVLITVIVELPHSTETGWGAKGLAGHSAMAIGDRYFDYGPNNRAGTYSEKDYDADFNNDGDKVDDVYLASPSFKNSPGIPWWGNHIAKRKSITPNDVKLKDVLDHIKLHWKIDGTGIYGEVHKIEFYVKESEANKMIKWWEERYKHLKIYSVFPWTGEQCTTTVKTAIQEAFPLKKLGPSVNYIFDDTQKPSGLLSELKKFISTSKQHYDEKAKITILKQEDADWPNPYFMKKNLIIMLTLSIFSCTKYKKIYSNDPKFNKIESTLNIDTKNALNIYNTTFYENFKIKKKDDYETNHYIVIYIKNKFYYIGYVSKLDKRGKKDGHLYFLAKIDSETGKIAKVED